MARHTNLSHLLTDHQAAVRAYVERAVTFPAERWHVPRAPGKWTPAQETRHLILTYQRFALDLRGEGGMQLKGTWWQRRLWRFLFLRKLLEGRFPAGARAPREVRPPDESADPKSLVAELQGSAAQFEAMVEAVHRENLGRGGRHPYFGRLSLAQVVRFNTVHTRHHMRQGLGTRE